MACNVWSRPNSDTNREPESNSNAHTYPDGNSDRHADSNSYNNTESYTNAHCNSGCHVDADPDPNTAAAGFCGECGLARDAGRCRDIRHSASRK